jgi:GT2 family glycosyltransferase
MSVEPHVITETLPWQVYAVVVVYERTLDAVAPWPALQSWMAQSMTGQGPLRGVLVYDNSAVPRIDAANLPTWATYLHDRSNGGTAAAYVQACAFAQARACTWLLMLDHDTHPPDTLLPLARQAIQRAERPPAAVLPIVMHADLQVSPSSISASGTLRPWRSVTEPKAAGLVTGIASGALLRLDALQALLPLPSGLWLDYVDHWMFTQLQHRGQTVCVSTATLAHDLSVVNPQALSVRRMESILEGERLFIRSLGWSGRCAYPLRLLARAWKLRRRPDLARRILARAAGFWR